MADDPLPAARRANEQAQHLRDLMTLIRLRTDATAKGFAAVALAAVSALGYAKFADVFPYEGPDWSLPLLGVGIVLMLGGMISLVREFEDIAEPIITRAGVEETIDLNTTLNCHQRRTLKEEYNRVAHLKGAESLRAYNARAHRFERIADRVGGDTAHELRLRADVIRAEVCATEDRAVVYLLRSRAQQAFFGGKTIVWVLVFIAGWYSTAFAADAISAHREEADSPARSSGSEPGMAHPQPVLLPHEEHV